MATRRELIEAIAGRYHAATRVEKKTILDEFIKVTGFHRKHAIRALKQTPRESATAAPRSRLYDEAVRSALTILWEAADRICGKRLKQAIPTLVDAMERHGHLQQGAHNLGWVLPRRGERQHQDVHQQSKLTHQLGGA